MSGASRAWRTTALLAPISLALLAAPARPAERGATGPFAARVLSVGDGDTLRVSQDGKPLTLRLVCIDAPELAQGPWGVASRAHLQALLPRGQAVEVRPHGRDRYGRTLAELIAASRLVNLAMVEDGQAFAYRKYLASCDAATYLEAERRASRRPKGVWQQPGGISRPWLFRQQHRSTPIPDGSTPDGRRYSCRSIGFYARAQQLLHQRHTYLDGNGDGQACESLR